MDNMASRQQPERLIDASLKAITDPSLKAV
jgi:hypothetical protein